MQKENGEIEKREHARTPFEPLNRPKLKIGAYEFQVKDISAKGLCLFNPKNINLSGWISGTLMFSDNTSREIDAIVVRNRDKEMGLHLVGSN